jgi:hypothetical protein
LLTDLPQKKKKKNQTIKGSFGNRKQMEKEKNLGTSVKKLNNVKTRNINKTTNYSFYFFYGYKSYLMIKTKKPGGGGGGVEGWRGGGGTMYTL